MYCFIDLNQYCREVGKTLNITLPVFNEAATLEIQINRLQDFLKNAKELGFIYSVTVADNGSSDDTLKIAEKLSKIYLNMSIISIPHPGVGGALQKAWENSNHDFMGYMDLDFSVDLNHLYEVERHLSQGFDCVLGNRLSNQSTVVGRSKMRTVTSYGLNLIVRIIFRVRARDVMCGFKFFQRDALKFLINNSTKSPRWFYCAEIYILAHVKKFKIQEISVTWIDDKFSKVKIIPLIFEYLQDIIILKKHLSLRQRSISI